MRRALRVVLFNTLISFVLLLGIEVTSRAFAPSDPPSPLITFDDSFWAGKIVADADLFWRLRPGIVVGHERLTNRHGLRGPEIAPKSTAEYRILSLGESSTFARQVAYDQTYSSRLEAGLGLVDGRRVRVVNAGIPAYTLYQGVRYLATRGLALEPDAVLVYFGFNDFIPATLRAFSRGNAGSRARTDRELHELRSGLAYRVSHALATHSNLFRWMLWRRLEGSTVEVDENVRRVPPEERLRLLGELRALCAQNDLRLVVAIPWYREFDEHAPLLRAAAAHLGIATVDLPRILANRSGQIGAYFVDPVHPNARGHRLIARALTTGLRREWAQPAATGRN